MREIADNLYERNHKIYCISAIPEGRSEYDRIKQIKETGVRFTGIEIVLHKPNPSYDDTYKAGLKKAEIMKDHNITLLFDDNEIIAKAVRDQGLLCAIIKPL